MSFFKKLFSGKNQPERENVPPADTEITLTDADIFPLNADLPPLSQEAQAAGIEVGTSPEDNPFEVERTSLSKESLHQKSERELEKFSKLLFKAAERVEPGLSAHVAKNIQSWKKILKTDGQRLESTLTTLSTSDLPPVVKSFWAKKIMNPKSISSLLLDSNDWQKLLSSLTPATSTQQEKAFALMMDITQKEGSFKEMLKRIDEGKNYNPKWAQQTSSFVDFVKTNHQKQLDSFGLRNLEEDEVRTRWAVPGNTFAAYAYEQPHEGVISLERAKKEVQLQIAIYFEKGVRVGELTEIFVAPALRKNQLLGPRLIQLAEQILRESGVEKARARTSNPSVEKLLVRKGFTYVGEDPVTGSKLFELTGEEAQPEQKKNAA